jgi:hypothetical protein
MTTLKTYHLRMVRWEQRSDVLPRLRVDVMIDDWRLGCARSRVRDESVGFRRWVGLILEAGRLGVG